MERAIASPVFVRPMLNSRVDDDTTLADEFVARAIARVDAGRVANKIVVGICTAAGPSFTADNWILLMRIWETLNNRRSHSAAP
jgi:hypothetical protein